MTKAGLNEIQTDKVYSGARKNLSKEMKKSINDILSEMRKRAK